jgi:hypothetical protein
MMKATFDDVNLILRLYENAARRSHARSDGTGSPATSRFRTLEEWTALCAPGTDANASYRMVTSYWEMVASFITSGVLNPELFYQSGRELLFCYARVRHVLPALREKLGNPGEMKNLETVAQGFIAWWNQQSPGAYDAFCKRIGA